MGTITITDHKTRIIDIARELGVGRNTVSRRIRKTYGKTFRSVRRELMLELVRSRRDDESVSAFCARTGIPRSTYYWWRQQLLRGGEK